MSDVDALVIGSGPNGLVAACALARAGWSVLVCEQAPEPGGGVRSERATLPGYVHDHCAGFFPMVRVSPYMRALDLEGAGVSWRLGEIDSVHPRSDGTAVWVSRDMDDTAKSLDAACPGDGVAWLSLMSWLRRAEDPLLRFLLSPVPNVRAAAAIAARLRVHGLMRLARIALMPVRDLAEQEFEGDTPGRVLGSLALHGDLTPEQAGSGALGLILTLLTHKVGFPFPAGGAGRITDALLRRLTECGGEVRCGTPVTRVVVRRGRAVAVEAGEVGEIGVRRAVLADTGAPALFLGLVGADHLPPRFLDGLRRFRYGPGVFKMDWALDGPVPWDADACRRAAVVHIGDDIDDLSRAAGEVVRGLLPSRPSVLLGQQSLFDRTRVPDEGETLWGYTHVPGSPRGDADGLAPGRWPESREVFADRMEARIEACAPGFTSRIRERRILDPLDLQAANPNLVGGEHSGGTMAPHQMLVFRPVPGWFRYRTPVKGLYLASASAHPGGAVHGACGGGAAAAALRDHRLRRI